MPILPRNRCTNTAKAVFLSYPGGTADNSPVMYAGMNAEAGQRCDPSPSTENGAWYAPYKACGFIANPLIEYQIE